MSHEAPDVRHIPSSSSLVSVSWFTAAALAGWAGCGFSSNAAGKLDASVPPPDVDGAVVPLPDAAPGTTCYGPAGWQACFDAPLSGNITLPATLDTTKSPPCLSAQPMGWAAPQPAACFIVGDTITVPSGGTVVNGRKPLVLVARNSITVAGVLDVASHFGDMGTAPSECQSFPQDPSPQGTNIGGGGGGGGSFMTRGGNGGNGDGGTQNGQSASADTMAPDHLRSGCPGQAGGALNAGDAGKLGLGGGKVYLLSGATIALQNSINASGAGGGGGKKGNGGVGGGGGGSGGMIVLYATTITVSGTPVLMANGGGGGGGGTMGAVGTDGSDPSLTSPLIPASGGGNGGKGYPELVAVNLDGGDGAMGTGGGGGGGGGAAGYIRSNKPLLPLTGVMVSPPAIIVP